MAGELRNCVDCGRLFTGSAAVVRCAECFDRTDSEVSRLEQTIGGGGMSVTDIARGSGMSLDRVRTILQEAKVMSRNLRKEGRCDRCGRYGRLPDADHCLSCQLELFKSLGDAAADVLDAERLTEDRGSRRLSVLEAVQEKRRRTGGYRFSVSPRNVKGAN